MKKRSIFPDHLCPYCKSCRISIFKRSRASHIRTFWHPQCPRCGAELKLASEWMIGQYVSSYILFIITAIIIMKTEVFLRYEWLFFLPMLIVLVIRLICIIWGKFDYEESPSHPKPPVYVIFKYVDPPAIEIIDNQNADTPNEGEDTDGTDCGN